MKLSIALLLASYLAISPIAWAEQTETNKPFLNEKLSPDAGWSLLQRLADTYANLSFAEKDDSSGFGKYAHLALVEGNVDGAMDLAYSFHGMNNTSISRPMLIEKVLEPHSNFPKAQALIKFIDDRSVPNALELLEKADTPHSLAIAYMCVAEAEYAKGGSMKAIMASVLSLAYDFSEEREEQAKFYLTGYWGSPVSLRGTKDEVADRLVTIMKDIYEPRKFKQYFAMLSVLGLLPEFPYTSESLSEEPREPIHIVIGFDANYTYHGGVTMLSAMLSADPATRYVFHVPEDPESPSPITPKQMQGLYGQAGYFPAGKYDVVFEKYRMDLLPEQLHAETWNLWPRCVMFKLYIPEFYADHDKIMWLDSDLIVRSDVTPFYNLDLNGNWLLGVRDHNASNILPRLGLREDDSYINVGVMVFDNISLRKNKSLLSETLASVDDEGKFFVYPEQDTFAVAFKGHIKEEGYQTRHHREYYFPNSHWNWGYHKTHPTETWDQIHKHFAYVFHLNGSHKPWKIRWSQLKWSLMPRMSDGMQNLYWALRDMGPWPMKVREK